MKRPPTDDTLVVDVPLAPAPKPIARVVLVRLPDARVLEVARSTLARVRTMGTRRRSRGPR